MSRAVLLIDADTSPARTAFGDLRGAARSAQSAITTEARKASRERERVARDEARAVNRAAAQASRERQRLERTATNEAKRADRERTREAAAGAAQRLRVERDEAREKARTARDATRAATAADRDRTRTAERESSKRMRQEEREAKQRVALSERRVRAAGGRAAAAVGGAGRALMGGAVAAHGQMQDARERTASSEHTLNAAFFQAGVGDRAAAGMRQRLQHAVGDDNGPLRGLSMQQVAESINAAQTQFSVLSRTDEQRRAGVSEEDAHSVNLDRQIQNMALARNTYQDPGEVLRVAGLLQQQGVTGDDQRNTLLSLTGMAQAGSIELSTLTSTALGPLMANIARSTNANMTPAQRAAAVRATASETMAVGEIGAAAGLNPRDSLNAMSKLRGSVSSPMVQGRLYDRLHRAGRDDLAGQLFQTGADGTHALKDGNAVNLMSSLVSGFGGDANAVNNLLAAGGAGAPMVLDSQQRRLITAMASQTEGGGTIAQRVAGMQAIGGRFGETDVARGAAMVNSEQGTTLQAGQEKRDAELTDNTNGVTNLSNTIRDWQVRHPFLSEALPENGSTFGIPNTAILGGYLGNSANEDAVRTGRDANGRQVGGAERNLRGLGIAFPFLGALLGGSDIATPAAPNLRAPAGRGATPGGSGPVQVSLTAGDHAAIGQQTAAALRAAPITAAVSPVDDIHGRAAGTRR